MIWVSLFNLGEYVCAAAHNTLELAKEVNDEQHYLDDVVSPLLGGGMVLWLTR